MYDIMQNSLEKLYFIKCEFNLCKHCFKIFSSELCRTIPLIPTYFCIDTIIPTTHARMHKSIRVEINIGTDLPPH